MDQARTGQPSWRQFGSLSTFDHGPDAAALGEASYQVEPGYTCSIIHSLSAVATDPLLHHSE